ncbi:MAG: LytR C-terminal domain-containing protein [Sphingomicrobium sp.]
MRRNLLVAALSIAAIACTQQGKLSVRALPSPLAQGAHPVSYRVAEAAGQFALGNVALALEGYRKALREEPDSIDALIGRAACYDAFGRFDMSRRDYEAALALAPADASLLGLFAASLLRQGRGEEAASVRGEIQARRLVGAAPAMVAAAVTLTLPVAREMSAEGITLALLPAAPIVGEAVLPPSAAPVRLERLSLGEVALVTTPGRRFPDLSPARVAVQQSSLVKTAAAFVPSLRPDLPAAVAARSQRPILVLNAARSQGLASRTRSYLAARGFGPALIGDAWQPRERSLIIAPPSERRRALQLARTFAFPPQTIVGTRLTLVLGRDALRSRPQKS